MLKLTKTGIGLLTRQYRSVLRKCWLINVGLWQAMGDAVSKAVSVPARLVASLLSGGAMDGMAFNVLDEILLTRLFERKLASLTAIGLGIAAATMPNEAEAGVLCYASDGTVKYTTGTTCPTGTSYRLISLGGIDSSATIGDGSTALGYLAQATGLSSTALGHQAQATSGNSTAVGYAAKATGDQSTALGYNAQATSEKSTALGYEAKATSFSTALGHQAQATGEGSIAIGYKSVADEANTVSFGRFGADSATLEQMKYDIDDEKMSYPQFMNKYAQYDASKAGALYLYYKDFGVTWEQAVEESNIAGVYRRITNVADAVNAHDAVTLGQLQNNYYRKLMKKDKNLIKTANDNDKSVIVRSAKHDVTIFGRQSDNTATTTKQAA